MLSAALNAPVSLAEVRASKRRGDWTLQVTDWKDFVGNAHRYRIVQPFVQPQTANHAYIGSYHTTMYPEIVVAIKMLRGGLP